MNQLKKIAKTYKISNFLSLVALMFIVSCVNPNSRQPTSIPNYSNNSAVFTLLAVGSAFITLADEVDVSVGVAPGMSAVVRAALLRDGSNWTVTILVALAIGATIGFVNGFGMSALQIPSLIFILGVNGVARSLIYVFIGGVWAKNPPAEYTRVSNALIAEQLTVFYVVAILVMTAGHMVPMQTKESKYLIAVRDNAAGAILVSIPASQTKIIAYVISGIFAVAAGMIYTLRIGFIMPTTDNNYEMKVTAACVLRRINPTGDQGSLIGASIGAVVMSSINRILVLLGSFSDYNNIIIGTLLVTVVVINIVTQSRAVLKNRHQILSARIAMGADRKGGVQSRKRR